jgi:hypothetical protein
MNFYPNPDWPANHTGSNSRVNAYNSGNNEKDGPLFHIVAGTSIGPMNAAVLVRNVVKRRKTWLEAAKVLKYFWIDQAKLEEGEDEKNEVYPLLLATAMSGTNRRILLNPFPYCYMAPYHDWCK